MQLNNVKRENDELELGFAVGSLIPQQRLKVDLFAPCEWMMSIYAKATKREIADSESGILASLRNNPAHQY